MTATSASEVPKPTTVAPSSSPPHAERRGQDPARGTEPAAADQPLSGADDGTGDEAGRPAAASGSSTRPATTPPATPAMGKARNPAVQISHEMSAYRLGVEGS